jgi:hypothetical protein
VTASSTGQEYADPLIDHPGNRAIIEGAFQSLAAKFAAQGKRLVYIWPRSLKAEWVDTTTGEEGSSKILADDPDIRDLRNVYAEAKGGKDGKEHLHNVGTWTYRIAGLRGDGSGVTPLQKSSPRIKRECARFTNQHLTHALDGARTPAAKIRTLRTDYISSGFSRFLSLLIQNRIAEFTKRFNAEKDLEKRDSLRKVIDKYRAMQSSFEADTFAVRWALSHPLSGNTPEAIHASLQRRTEELETFLGSKKGERRPVHPASNFVPAIGPLINKGINWAADRTDDALQPKEREYLRDVAELNISFPDHPEAESYVYSVICKREGKNEKNDSIALALVKFARSIDEGKANPEDEFFDHPMVERLFDGIPPGEQQLMKNQIAGFADAFKKRANELKPTDIPAIVQGTSAANARRHFNAAIAVVNGKHPMPPFP